MGSEGTPRDPRLHLTGSWEGGTCDVSGGNDTKHSAGEQAPQMSDRKCVSVDDSSLTVSTQGYTQHLDSKV